jgi:hypothetical protein
MANLVNIREYYNLCDMSFRQVSTMTSQLAVLDGSDNFSYLLALEDICARLESENPILKGLRPQVTVVYHDEIIEIEFYFIDGLIF